MKKWIQLHNCPGPEPAWFDDNGKPIVFDTQKEAVAHLLEDHISSLKSQLQEVLAGHREPDEVDLEPNDWVEECTVHEDGSITTETEGEIYNPKTYVR